MTLLLTTRLLTTLAVTTLLMAPALAQDAAQPDTQPVACAAFMAMTTGDQKAAMAMAMMTDAKATQDMMAPDGAMATDGAAASSDAMVSDDAVAMAAKMCAAHPDMMMADALHAMN